MWGILSDYIKDGIIGKTILFFMAIGAIGVFSKCVLKPEIEPLKIGVSETTLVVSFTAYWLRHLWLCYVFRRWQQWYFKAHPHRDRRRKCSCSEKPNN